MESAGRMQNQLRQNNEELLDYLKGLESWEDEIREKDEKLSKNKSILKENFPPVRSSVTKKEKKRKKREPAPPASRIHSYNYGAWDKFDVEKACEEVDYEVESSSGSEGEGEREAGGSAGGSSEEEEMERQRAMAVTEKKKGNDLYKEGDYEAAVECYSRGMMLDPLSAVLPANRAMALMKLERYAAVEEDCSTALALDEDYVKAYLRRGVARRHLRKLSDAVEDFERVLKLEPKNKQAMSELKIAQHLRQEEERKRLTAEGHVFPVKRPAHLQSKKPLKRVGISDIAGQAPTTATGSAPLIPQSADTATREPLVTSEPQASDTSTTENTNGAQRDGKHQNNETSSPQSVLCQSGPVEDEMTGGERDTGGSTVPPQPAGSDEKSSMGAIETTGGEGGSTVRAANRSVGRVDGEDAGVPAVPETTFQFQSDWKTLRHNWPLLVSYFKQLPPARYPDLLQQSLETDIFSDIISILQTTPGCVEELTWLTRVQRFSVAVMFLSETDRNNLQGVFADLVDTCRTESKRDILKTLSSKFGIKLKS